MRHTNPHNVSLIITSVLYSFNVALFVALYTPYITNPTIPYSISLLNLVLIHIVYLLSLTHTLLDLVLSLFPSFLSGFFLYSFYTFSHSVLSI